MRIKTLGVSIAAAALALTAPLTACSNSDTEATSTPVEVVAEASTGPERVNAIMFSALVATAGVTVIDVRTPEEFTQSHIQGAVNYIVKGPDFATQIAALDPAGIYAVYCQSGNRSQPAVAQMSSAGIENIYELDSGISGWESAGFPVVS
jgi:phage shock protein E